MDQQEGFRRLRSVAVLGSAAWLLLVFFGAFYVFGLNTSQKFAFLVSRGIIPVVLVWAAIWVAQGFAGRK
jgi:hypothetical protein